MSKETPSFLEQFSHGYFRSLLRWHELDLFWETLRRQQANRWYLYAIGDTPPQAPVESDTLLRFIDEIDALLHRDHHEDYCGIVYTDSIEAPTLIKIYDPHNLGSVCGSRAGPPTLPGWVLSLSQPEDLQHALPQTGSRKRWWQTIFS